MTLGILLRGLRDARDPARQRQRHVLRRTRRRSAARWRCATGTEAPVPDQVNDVVNIAAIGGDDADRAGGGNDVVRVNFDGQGIADVRERRRRPADAARRGRQRPLRDRAVRQRSRRSARSRGSWSTTPRRTTTSASTAARASARTTPTSSCCAPTRSRRPASVAAFEVDANKQPVVGRLLRARSTTTARSTAASRSSAATGDDTFVLDDNLAPTTIFGDAGDGHVPGRPGLPVAARRLEPGQRPRTRSTTSRRR